MIFQEGEDDCSDDENSDDDLDDTMVSSSLLIPCHNLTMLQLK